MIYIIFDSFRAIANRLGLMDDEKAGVARTAYLGIVTLFWKVLSFLHQFCDLEEQQLLRCQYLYFR